jgi:hypothetical protein
MWQPSWELIFSVIEQKRTIACKWLFAMEMGPIGVPLLLVAVAPGQCAGRETLHHRF